MTYCVYCNTPISDEQSRRNFRTCVACLNQPVPLAGYNWFPSTDQRRPASAEEAKGDEYEDQ